MTPDLKTLTNEEIARLAEAGEICVWKGHLAERLLSGEMKGSDLYEKCSKCDGRKKGGADYFGCAEFYLLKNRK